MFPWSKHEASPPEYGSLLNRVLSRMVGSMETAGPNLSLDDMQQMRDTVKRAWREAEVWEKELSSTKPPGQLKPFHQRLVKGVRAVILGHGSMARLAAGTARQYYVLGGELLTQASSEMQLVKSRDPALYSSLGLEDDVEKFLLEG